MKFKNGKMEKALPNGLGNNTAYFDGTTSAEVVELDTLPIGSDARTIFCSFYLEEDIPEGEYQAIFSYGKIESSKRSNITICVGRHPSADTNALFITYKNETPQVIFSTMNSSYYVKKRKKHSILFMYDYYNDSKSSIRIFLDGVSSKYDSLDIEGVSGKYLNTTSCEITIGKQNTVNSPKCVNFKGNITNFQVFNDTISSHFVKYLHAGEDMSEYNIIEKRVLYLPLRYGKDDETLFKSKSFVYDTGKVETSSGFNALGKPIRYRSASGAECNFLTHPKKNLVLRYDFKSLTAETGQVFSQSGGGNVQFTTINGVQCAKFDGTSSLVTWDNTDVTEILDTNETTISVWFLPTLSTPLGCRILGRTSNTTNNTCFYQIELKANWGSPQISAKLGWNYGTSPYYDFRYPHDWIHLCVVQKSDSTYKLYIDGKEYGNDSNHGWTSKDAPLFIGSSHSSSYYFNGYMANLRIYNRALENKEIAILGKEVRAPELYIPDGTPAYFNGSENYAALKRNDLPLGTTPTTMSAWFYQIGGESEQNICGYGTSGYTNRQRFVFVSSGYIRSQVWSNDHSYTNVAIEHNKWYHVVMVYENATEKCYLNGELIGERSCEFDIYSSDNSFLIGMHDGTRYFCGNITNVNLYNRALSADEITQLYNKKEITNGRVLSVPLVKGEDDESIFTTKNFIYAGV